MKPAPYATIAAVVDSGRVLPPLILLISCRELEEKSDNMKQLENRTLDSKIELEIMDALDEIKAVNRRHETVDTADVLKASAARREKGVAGLVSSHACADPKTFSLRCCRTGRVRGQNIPTGVPLQTT